MAHDLDDVDALGGELLNYRRAFLDAGANAAEAQKCIVAAVARARAADRWRRIAVAADIEGVARTLMRGPGKRPSATASRTAMTAQCRRQDRERW